MDTQAEVRITYYTRLLFSTVEMNALVTCLMKEFDGCLEISIAPMSNEEKEAATDYSHEIQMVAKCFFLYQIVNGECKRREDLEEMIANYGLTNLPIWKR